MKLEVRCCCQPTKLLGFLVVPDPSVAIGQYVVYEGRSAPVVTLDDRMMVPRAPDRFALPVAKYSPMVGRERLAFKAEGLTLEQLMTIPGFTPA